MDRCSDRLESWDRSWNDADEQVRGAENSGHIFLKADRPGQTRAAKMAE